MKTLVMLHLLFILSHAVVCNEDVDVNTGVYDAECAALYLNLDQTQHNNNMALMGFGSGLIFMVGVIFATLNIGRTYRV